mmetsp:Transcript_13360/g.25091  ORF Transcript_13360/g.25091 Transcript_13360/m.25091 type:complete len:232 (-) Transcript_13360:1938-2633(-)
MVRGLKLPPKPCFSAKSLRILDIDNDLITLGYNAHPVTNFGRRLFDYTIPSLKQTAAEHKLVSLSAPQVDIPYKLFVIYRNLIDNKWTNYAARPEDYDVFINPVLIEKEGMQRGLESCASVPHFRGLIKRFSKIKVEFVTEDNEDIAGEMEGFTARVFLHELDHLYGNLISYMHINECQGEIDEDKMDPEIKRQVDAMMMKMQTKPTQTPPNEPEKDEEEKKPEYRKPSRD